MIIMCNVYAMNMQIQSNSNINLRTGLVCDYDCFFRKLVKSLKPTFQFSHQEPKCNECNLILLRNV